MLLAYMHTFSKICRTTQCQAIYLLLSPSYRNRSLVQEWVQHCLSFDYPFVVVQVVYIDYNCELRFEISREFYHITSIFLLYYSCDETQMRYTEILEQKLRLIIKLYMLRGIYQVDQLL